MDIAVVVAQRSHDAETKVGAVLINNKTGAIISTGYNGFVRGANDTKLPNTRPEKYEFILHAELNLISNSAMHGLSMQDCTLICTMSPCKLCMRMMVNCGITKVIAKELYKDFDDILKMPDIATSLLIREDGLYEITYEMEKKR